MKKIARDTDRDYYLTSEQAQEYGLIDEVLAASGDPATEEEKKSA